MLYVHLLFCNEDSWWQGCTWWSTKDGRLAFLANVLEPDAMPSARTRGDLPLRFLQGNKSPLEVATEVAKEADEYNGFNLILADLTRNVMVYVSNQPKGQPVTIQLVSPGLRMVSNARLDSPWQKAIRLGKNFREFIRKHGDDEVEAMTDTTRADKDMLPNTGCDANWEHGLSSIFIEVQTDKVSIKSEGLEHHQRTSHGQGCVEACYPCAGTMSWSRDLMGFTSSLPQLVWD